MTPLDHLQEAEMRRQFRLMYADLGLAESLAVLNEIIMTAAICIEVITEELNAEEREGH